MDRHELFVRLQRELPEIGASEHPDEQTRAVLRAVVDRVVAGVVAVDPVPADPSTCPNCGSPCQAQRTPFCSGHCRAQAAFVRQFRTLLVTGPLFEVSRQLGMGESLWDVVVGGFPRRQFIVPPRVVVKVIEREAGKCQMCGGEAVTVEHEGSGCSRPINLRPVCASCNRAARFGRRGFDLDPDLAPVFDEIATRVAPEQAIRACDDASAWDWRAFLRDRKTSLR